MVLESSNKWILIGWINCKIGQIFQQVIWQRDASPCFVTPLGSECTRPLWGARQINNGLANVPPQNAPSNGGAVSPVQHTRICPKWAHSRFAQQTRVPNWHTDHVTCSKGQHLHLSSECMWCCICSTCNLADVISQLTKCSCTVSGTLMHLVDFGTIQIFCMLLNFPTYFLFSLPIYFLTFLLRVQAHSVPG